MANLRFCLADFVYLIQELCGSCFIISLTMRITPFHPECILPIPNRMFMYQFILRVPQLEEMTSLEELSSQEYCKEVLRRGQVFS